MPINIVENLPVRKKLSEEKIFVMDENRAVTQDIRPLNVLILNLMPEKQRTELQLLRLLGNTPLQVNVTFMHMETHDSKNTSKSHLDTFYELFKDVKGKRYDGLIITGAPIEHLKFKEVNYWQELQEVMEWSKEHVTSVLHICWGAQAALYHHYGIDKFELPTKCFGVFQHVVTDSTVKLTRGFNDVFTAPHSRYTSVSSSEVENDSRLTLLSHSEDAGAFIIISKDERHIMITGHLEYDALTLSDEYTRDLQKGIEVSMPVNYFPHNDVSQQPINTWRSHTHLLFSNWLNYYVYQQTPYEW